MGLIRYVFMCWVGEDASDAQRRQVSMQLLFFRDYFHSANVRPPRSGRPSRSFFLLAALVCACALVYAAAWAHPSPPCVLGFLLLFFQCLRLGLFDC